MFKIWKCNVVYFYIKWENYPQIVKNHRGHGESSGVFPPPKVEEGWVFFSSVDVADYSGWHPFKRCRCALEKTPVVLASVALKFLDLTNDFGVAHVVFSKI